MPAAREVYANDLVTELQFDHQQKVSRRAVRFVKEHSDEAVEILETMAAMAESTEQVSALVAEIAAAVQQKRIDQDRDGISPELAALIVDDDMDEGGDLINVSEAAQLLGTTRATVYNWIKAGKLIAWGATKQRKYIPREQILSKGNIVAGIDQVMAVLIEPEIAWDFLAHEHPFENDYARPLDLLKSDRIDDVVKAAQGFGMSFQ